MEGPQKDLLLSRISQGTPYSSRHARIFESALSTASCAMHIRKLRPACRGAVSLSRTRTLRV